MKIGAAMFFTDYSMSPGELAVALEERGFDSLWAPEHSHIPLERTASYPGGGALPREYYEVMDPFVTLTAAATVTKKLLVGTGICLVVQRDPIQTAKAVATIDHISGGRFLFGVGNGWMPHRVSKYYADVGALIPQFRQLVAEAGRREEDLPITIWGVKEDCDALLADRDLGVARVVLSLASAKRDEILPELDRWAALIRSVA